MNKKSIIVSILVLSIIGCVTGNKFQKVGIENIAQSQTLTLIADNKLVHGLEVYIEGHLDDTAKIGTTFIGPGNVKIPIHSGDYYVDTFRVFYDPYRAREGVLTVKYCYMTN